MKTLLVGWLSLLYVIGVGASQGAKPSTAMDGNGSVVVSGELKRWHKVTLTLDGPYAHERDTNPNPFTDYRMSVEFTHESGAPRYVVPGYFATDGNAGETSAESGAKWRAHLSPDKAGRWTYRVRFTQDGPLAPYDGKQGAFAVAPTDKTGGDLRAHGRLRYVGKHHLRFAGSGKYFLKAGADAPETFLAYKDFDGTTTHRRPLKSWRPHVKDWRPGDPTWQGGKGKGIIGAINYLSGKGCNAFSFLPYNAGGDGDNVWPFVARNAKLHYDCSKLDQWQVVFDHAQAKGVYLHFKLQETENDDRKGSGAAQSLDGGDLGPQRKLYCREMVARFGYLLALNWNIGEENTQTTRQQKDMIDYLREIDPYDHHIVLHTYPGQHDKVYAPLLGERSRLTGLSIQNSKIADTHRNVVTWVKRSAESGKPWVVALDEPGSAGVGAPPDPGYEGFGGKAKEDKDANHTISLHEVRKQVLWGALMAGGGGVEYYFGYQLPQNDLLCEDWRSRDKSWDYCRFALVFFDEHKVPFWQMHNADELVGNPKHDNSRYCLAQPGALYLVYLPDGGTCELDLSEAQGAYVIGWFNPRAGRMTQTLRARTIKGGGKRALGHPPSAEPGEDWLAVVRRQSSAR